MRIISAKYRAFRSQTSSRRYGKMHGIWLTFDHNHTTLLGGDLPPTDGSANTEEFCEILRKFKLFARFSRGFREVFAKFFLVVPLRKTHIFADFRTSFQFSQCCSMFATYAIFAIGVSQCFAKFRKSSFASFASTSFARFRKYQFRRFTFVSQDSQVYCEKHIFSLLFAILLSFRSATQFSQPSRFLQLVFRSVSPSFANCVSQVSQILV